MWVKVWLTAVTTDCFPLNLPDLFCCRARVRYPLTAGYWASWTAWVFFTEAAG
jgi:hypothetical protein